MFQSDREPSVLEECHTGQFTQSSSVKALNGTSLMLVKCSCDPDIRPFRVISDIITENELRVVLR